MSGRHRRTRSCGNVSVHGRDMLKPLRYLFISRNCSGRATHFTHFTLRTSQLDNQTRDVDSKFGLEDPCLCSKFQADISFFFGLWFCKQLVLYHYFKAECHWPKWRAYIQLPKFAVSFSSVSGGVHAHAH